MKQQKNMYRLPLFRSFSRLWKYEKHIYEKGQRARGIKSIGLISHIKK